jgi:alkanesulfonate monooxygenase SsuD/methylene tetrahydromethanopterin reductase-like flavin-dependent oxidoreductase (luciferase family)
VIGPRVAAIRKLAAEAGRDPAAILIFAMMTVILAPTDSEALAKLADYRRYVARQGALTLMSGWTGIDFSRFDPNQVVEHVTSEAGRTAMENITRADPDRRWTVREVAEHVSIGGIGPVIAGSPATVADQLEQWIEDTGIDGFNMAFAVRPETFVDIVDLLVPELQRRGRYKTAYAKGTLREKLFGRPRLSQHHPAAAYRWI